MQIRRVFFVSLIIVINLLLVPDAIAGNDTLRLSDNPNVPLNGFPVSVIDPRDGMPRTGFLIEEHTDGAKSDMGELFFPVEAVERLVPPNSDDPITPYAHFKYVDGEYIFPVGEPQIRRLAGAPYRE